MKRIWKINEPAPKDFLEKFPEFSKLTLQLLWDRNLKTQKEIDEFFNPDYNEDLHDPFLLKDIKKALKRIEQAGEKKEKVAIFADYDADGICGAVLLTEIFAAINIHPEIYIPDRNKEGYGLSLEAVERAVKKGITLALTIDCGVTDFEEVKLAKKLGMDVIIIDHHEIPQKLPSAFAVIDPKQKQCKYPFKDLSATGVAFKLVQAFAKVKKIPQSWEKWMLDLVAISTVTDSMLLLGENRTLVKYGLIVLSKTKRAGLKVLLEKTKTDLNTYTLGFIIGPRINAASRVDHGSTAYGLLVALNETEAKEIAQRLEEHNKERQRQMERMLKEVRQRILKYNKKEKIIFEGDRNWVAGIIGLVAQKLRNELWKPCFIYQEIGDQCIGSVRGIPGFNVVEVLTKCRKFLLEFGGHYGAAGFKVLNKNLEKFHDLLEKYSNKELQKEELIPYLNIDIETDISDLNWDTFEQIEKFEPFGEGNSRPLFLLRRVGVLSMRNVGLKENHLKLSLEKETKNGVKKFNAIGFNLVDVCDKIKIGDIIDVVFEVINNEWNGTKELQLKIIDFKKI